MDLFPPPRWSVLPWTCHLLSERLLLKRSLRRCQSRSRRRVPHPLPEWIFHRLSRQPTLPTPSTSRHLPSATCLPADKLPTSPRTTPIPSPRAPVPNYPPNPSSPPLPNQALLPPSNPLPPLPPESTDRSLPLQPPLPPLLHIVMMSTLATTRRASFS